MESICKMLLIRELLMLQNAPACFVKDGQTEQKGRLIMKLGLLCSFLLTFLW